MTTFDYINFNYCSGCRIPYGKDVITCKRCGRRVRSTPRTSKGKRNILKKKKRALKIKTKKAVDGESLILRVQRNEIVDSEQLGHEYIKLHY